MPTNKPRSSTAKAKPKPRARKPLDLPKTAFRSALTTGRELIADLDGRCGAARRYRDLVAMHVADLGGEDLISSAELNLIKRAATLTMQLELMESKFAANGGASLRELETYQRTAGGLRRLLESLGLRRRAKDITPPDPLDYARSRSKALEAA